MNLLTVTGIKEKVKALFLIVSWQGIIVCCGYAFYLFSHFLNEELIHGSHQSTRAAHIVSLMVRLGRGPVDDNPSMDFAVFHMSEGSLWYCFAVHFCHLNWSSLTALFF